METENCSEAHIDALFRPSVTKLFPKNALSWNDSSEMPGCRREVFEVMNHFLLFRVTLSQTCNTQPKPNQIKEMCVKF